MCGEPDPSREQRELAARLRAAIEAKDAELAALRAGLGAVLADLETERELARRLDLRVAELERQLRMDSSDSGSECSNVAALSGPAEPITGQ